jgi:hypothetical protein
MIRVRLNAASAAEELALRLIGALGLPDPWQNACCAAFGARTVGLLWRGHDIAIVSVLGRHGHSRGTGVDNCPMVGAIMNHASGLPFEPED